MAARRGVKGETQGFYNAPVAKSLMLSVLGAFVFVNRVISDYPLHLGACPFSGFISDWWCSRVVLLPSPAPSFGVVPMRDDQWPYALVIKHPYCCCEEWSSEENHPTPRTMMYHA